MPAPLLAPRGSHRWRSDRTPGWSDHPGNRGWWSDRPTPRNSFVVYFTDFCRAPRCAHDFGRAPRGTHDSTRATRDLNVHDFARASSCTGVLALLASPSGYTGATDTASTSAVTTGESHTGGTSDQPSSNDHTGETGLPATDRQTHAVGHLIATALSSAHLRPR
jgi:hypothetical protein